MNIKSQIFFINRTEESKKEATKSKQP